MTCDCVLISYDAPEENPPAKPFRDQASVDKARVIVIDAADRLYEEDSDRTHILETIPVVYNTRLRSTVARAMFMVKGRETTPLNIQVASKLELPEDYVVPVLVHEFCHVARGIESAYYDDERPHGWQWAALMRAADQKPDPYCLRPEVLSQMSTLRPRREQTPAWVVREQRSAFRIGDRVVFEGKGGVAKSGVIRKRNPKTANVRDDSGVVWRVPYALFHRE